MWVELDPVPPEPYPLVYNAAAPLVDTTLDLSAHIGLGNKLVLLFVASTTGSGTNYVQFKQNGDLNDYYYATADDGLGNTQGFHGSGTSGNYYYYYVPTDSSGKVSWKSNIAYNMKVYLVGYLDDWVSVVINKLTGSLPSSYAAVDLSGDLPITGKALIAMRYRWQSGPNDARRACRTNGELYSALSVAVNKLCGITTKGYSSNVDRAIQHLIMTDDDLKYEHISATAHNVIADCIGYSNDFSGKFEVVIDGTFPVGLTPLDLSGVIGKGKQLAYLRIRRRHGGGGLGLFIAQKFGDTFTHGGSGGPRAATNVELPDLDQIGYYLVPTDEDGKIEWYYSSNAQIEIAVLGFVKGPLQVDSIEQSTLNSVDVTFEEEPKKVDPSDPADSLNLSNYTVTGPVSPLIERLIQSAQYLGDNTVRIYFDGPLVPDEFYTITVFNVESIEGTAISPSGSAGSFVAFDADSDPIPLERQPSNRYDIRNPQTERDAPQGEPLGTFVFDDDGDLGKETKRRYLRKRVWRRIGTKKGGFFHMSNYGLRLDDKKTYNVSRLRRLISEIESQVTEERDVISARASVQQLAPGVILVKLRIHDIFGVFDTEKTIGEGYDG